MTEQLIHFNEEVQDALAENRPIVVLESTIISHGLPYPQNLETAIEVENLLRSQLVTPATIALHSGKIHIGLNHDLMEHLAESNNIVKASRRDLAYVLSRKQSASTTVSATMYCAHLAKLPLFVTGGIGGVHHDAVESFDISADLIELSSTPVTVVCAGAKSILDLPKTLEVLETHGVPVIGYGTNEFPAFYSRSSSIELIHRLDSPAEIAELMHMQRALGLNNGIVIANPIPADAELADAEIMPLIEQAHREAKHLSGQALTPFLLKRIAELSAGRSITANIALIKNNAFLGAQIAKSYQKKNIFKKK